MSTIEMDHSYNNITNICEAVLTKSSEEIEGEIIISNVSADFDSRLIDLVRAYPNLYDKFSPTFKSTADKEKSWSEVANALECSASFAQNRWLRLRERFSRERKLIEKRQKNGEELFDKKKVWPFFLRMLFLSSHIKPRRTIESGQVVVLKEDVEKRDFEGLQNEVEEGEDEEKKIEPKRKKFSDECQPEKQRKILAKPEEGLSKIFLSVSKGNDRKVGSKLPLGTVVVKPEGQAISTTPCPAVLVGGTTGTAQGKPAQLQTMFLATPQGKTPKPPSPSSSAEYHFGMLIAKELERLSPEERTRKKQKILMHLYE